MKPFRLALHAVAVFWLVAGIAEARDVATREIAAHTPEGDPVEVFTLANAHGLRARVLAWGATLIEMSVPDRAGKLADVTLGFTEPERYLAPHPFFGSIAGRYANRIARGMFVLDGQTFALAVNNGPNHLHGGVRGFDKRLWKAESVNPGSVRLSYVSADGEEGYPGELHAAVTYTLTDQNELRLGYEASADKPTVVNLTNHSYWNLAGTGDILSHELRLNASRFTVADGGLIPTGELRPVAGTPLDFTRAKPVGRDLAALEGEGLPGGHDHNYVIDTLKPGELALAAELRDPDSGRAMRVLTTEPGVQFYTANHLKEAHGKGGASYESHAGLCLETQHFPDSPNHPEFPSTVLRPGAVFHSTTVYEFSIR